MCHVGQDTIRQQFPAAMDSNDTMPDRTLSAKRIS